MWGGLCRALGATHLIADPRFATNADRHLNRHLLEPILTDLFLAGSVEEWIERLQRENVPVGEVRTLDRALADAQVHHRNMVLEIAADDGRATIRAAGNPVKFFGSDDLPPRYPPKLGAHSAETLHEILGISAAGIDALIAAQAVFDEGAANARRPRG
jgi:crotonobetainyl-CoA:carnitine CoA-transferase CaiB-like acyl-CoA transferase